MLYPLSYEGGQDDSTGGQSGTPPEWATMERTCLPSPCSS